MNQTIASLIFRSILLLVVSFHLAAVNVYATDKKIGVFMIRSLSDQTAAMERLQAHLKSELTALNQAVRLDAEQLTEDGDSSAEQLIIEIHKLARSKGTSIQLIRQSDGYLLHADILYLPENTDNQPGVIGMAGANIARQLVRKLDKLNYDTRIHADAQWASEPDPISWHFENIDQCRQDFLIASIEDGFPGTIAIMLEKSPTSKYSVYRYIGRANLQRQTQWLRTLLQFEGVESEAYKLFSSKNEIRIVFDDASALNPYVCAGSLR